MADTIQELAGDVVLALLGDAPGKRVLDMGAGDGAVARRLAEAGVELTILERALPSDPIPGVHYVAHDIDGRAPLPFASEHFDAVVSTEVVEHLRAPHLALAELARIVRVGGSIVLTMPNYWNIHYRIRYLLTGNLGRPFLDRADVRASYLQGYAPHITNLTYPVLKTVLTWEGCGAFQLGAARTYGLFSRLGYAPMLALIRISGWLRGRRGRARALWSETNGRAALLGRRHILISCRKQVAEVRDTA